MSESGKPTNKNLVAEVADIFKQTVQEMTELKSSDENLGKSSYDFLEMRFTDQLSIFKDSERDEVINIFHCLLDICKEDCGDDLQLLSLQSCGFEDDFKSDENFLLPNGFKSLLNNFEAYSSSKMELENEVVAIDWTEEALGIGKNVIVTCKNYGIQRIYKAKYVLSTLPLGILKSSHSTLFKPSLPLTKVTAIRNLGFGKVNKILIYYKNPFWIPGIAGYKMVWEHDKPPTFSIKAWAKHLTAFKEIKYNPNILVAWVTGQAALDLEDIPLSEISDVCTGVLRHFLQDTTIPKPDNIIMSKWCSDPYSKGAYTYIKKGEGIDDMYSLAAPINDSKGHPIILFAGEATDIDSYASVHGAMVSGEREASRLHGLLERKQYFSAESPK